MLDTPRLFRDGYGQVCTHGDVEWMFECGSGLLGQGACHKREGWIRDAQETYCTTQQV